MNAHDAIVDAILARLALAPAVTVGRIEEDIDTEALAETDDEAVSVSLVTSDPQAGEIYGHPVDWVSTVVIECYARRDSRGLSAGRASRALHAAVYARLMADPSLAGTASDVREPQISIEAAQRGTRLGCCTGTYPVWHRTAARTLEAP
jgi:hypothetical protein